MKFRNFAASLLALLDPRCVSGFALNDFNLFATADLDVSGQQQQTTLASSIPDLENSDPRSLHDYAIKLATSEKTSESLVYFEKAVELAPVNADFANDLGVTYMRLGKLDEAQSSFKKALKIDSSHSSAAQNLDAVYDHITFRDTGRSPQAFEDHEEEEYK